MSSLINLYLISEESYPEALSGDDESKYQELIAITEEEGMLWNTLELNMRGFEPAVRVWDAVAGNSRLLIVCTFNFYPHKLLPPSADISGPFGFFPAAMVKDLAEVMERKYDADLNDKVFESLFAKLEEEGEQFSEDVYEMVRDGYFMTFRDAAEQGKAVAVLIQA